MQKNEGPRVAVVGLYRSGSSAVAGLLHHLGFDMGAPYWGNYFEPFDLSASLRDWWNEPHLRQSFVDDDAVESLRAWQASRRVDARGLGAKHPLLSLMTNHLRRAWGPETKFIWAARDFERSCRSLERLGWWQNAREIQRLLWEALLQFRQQYDHLEVQHEAVLANPHQQLQRIADFLEVDCPASVIEQAASTIRTPHVKASTGSNASKKHQPGTCTVPSCKLVATMLCGNSEDMVTDAIRSVIGWVDELVLIDTGVTDRSTTRAEECAKEKLVVRQLPWVNDFAAARNAALRFAEQRGADWCITIDTDERLVFPPNISREDWIASICADPGITAWLVTDQKMGYAKERIFRLPCQDEWRGRTHEAFVMTSTARRRVHPWLGFWELPKNERQLKRKFERDLEILQEVTRDDPENARWWFYLGQTLEGLKRFGEAQEPLDRAFQLESWGEQAAWAAYCGARCAFELGDYEDAVERCCMGLTVQPQSPELFWLAGLCAFRLRRIKDAICWSELAAHLGSRTEFIDFRIAFKHLPAWYEGPYDVLRFAYRQTGDHAAADAAEKKYATRRAERLV